MDTDGGGETDLLLLCVTMNRVGLQSCPTHVSDQRRSPALHLVYRIE